jgi:hypothetical protein
LHLVEGFDSPPGYIYEGSYDLHLKTDLNQQGKPKGPGKVLHVRVYRKL